MNARTEGEVSRQKLIGHLRLNRRLILHVDG
jgi:hypothetical protein